MGKGKGKSVNKNSKSKTRTPRGNKKKRKVEDLIELESENLVDKTENAAVRDVSYLEEKIKRMRKSDYAKASTPDTTEEKIEEALELGNQLESKTVYEQFIDTLTQDSNNKKGEALKKKTDEDSGEDDESGSENSENDEEWKLTHKNLLQQYEEEKLNVQAKIDNLDFKETEEEEKIATAQESEGHIFGTEEEQKNDPYTTHFESPLPLEAEKKGFSSIKEPPEILGRVWSDNETALPQPRSNLLAYHVKNRLVESWMRHNHESVDNALRKRKNPNAPIPSRPIFTPLQEHLFPIINDYYDLLYCSRDYHNFTELRSLYVLHALNHVLKIRDRVSRHSARLKYSEDGDLEIRDQGFTRPRVLIIVPSRNDCLKVVETIIDMSPKINSERIANKKKFYEEYFAETDPPRTRKPDDWLARFRGNTDDNFRIGLNYTQKYIKLYSHFYHSDIIICSPLGLRMTMESNSGDTDYLSSIEMVIVDQVEVFLMQNWEHLTLLFKSLNQLPKEYRDADINRIRFSTLDGNAAKYRQSLFFSQIFSPELNALFNRGCSNFKGKFKIQRDPGTGTITSVAPKIRQLFQRLDCQNFQDVDDARFKYFTEKIYPHLLSDLTKGILIYIPSYFDYVRVRNFLRKKTKDSEITFTQCCEYTKKGHITRARSYFRDGRRDMLLVTERFHFFYRYYLKGIKRIVFYGLPSFPEFYPEYLNLLSDSGSCLAMFSSFDLYQLESILGTKRTSSLVNSSKNNHLFY
eukprot:TRINITY_DN3185_c0_g1_i1.p1 TRINITY_DN3185_c0_g1~~TRINITY_DN3185_c0_g1_i1.p1  ORF type:complete len:748 (-),score=195.91 TRINITY_DN3185_c0_g1_i1:31-2274(-)